MIWPTAAAADCAPAPIVRAEAQGSTGTGDCLLVDVGAAGRAGATFPDTGVSRGVSLPWARAELGARAGGTQARVVLHPARSGGEQGYVGIAGESWVTIVTVAEARVDWRRAGLALAGGVVDDVWTMTVQPVWSFRPVLRPMVFEQGFVPRSDVGGWAAWTAPDDLVDVAVQVTTGEGYQRRERNDGVNTTAVVRAHPLAKTDGELDVILGAMVRDGSWGLGQAPDHRLGAMVAAVHPRAAAGVDALLGSGLLGDGALAPAGASAWVRTGEAFAVPALARLDVSTPNLGADGAGTTLWLVGAGVHLPPGDAAPATLLLGYEGRRFGPDATPIAGSAALRASDTVFVQLQARVAGAVPFGGP
jgi:hypothetical protein